VPHTRGLLRWLLVLALLAGCRRDAPQPDAHARQAYDRYRQPDVLIGALAITPGMRVADVGAGAGYLTWRLARAVGPTGHVVATDVDARALAALVVGGDRELRPRVEARRVSADDPGLEPHAYDLILLSEVDHLLPDRVAYLGRLKAALKPGGRIAVSNRRTFRAALLDAATRAAYHLREADVLKTHFLVFLEVAS
jgi:predicted methyltransferase